MGSLKDCLEKIYGFAGSPEAEAVAKKAAELKAEGYTAKEAAREAVKFFIGNLADERAAVLAQVQKNISPSEQPGQTAFEFSKETGKKSETEAEAEAEEEVGAEEESMAAPVQPRAQTQPSPFTAPMPKGRQRTATLQQVEKRLGLPIRIGKFRQRAEGIYKRTPQVVRLKRANDLQTAAHEVGHHIQNLIGLGGRMPPEIKAMSYTQDPKKVNREGFAEFVRYYIVDPAKVKAEAPAFLKTFEDALDHHLDVADAISRIKESWNAWEASSAVQKISSMIQRGRDTQRKYSLNELYRDWVDEQHPITLLSRAMAERSGAPLEALKDPATMAWVTRGWARKAEQMLKHGTFQYDPDQGVVFTGESLREILKPVERAGDLAELDVYLTAKRAVSDRRILAGYKGILSKQEFSQAVEELEPKYGEIAKKLYKFQDEVLTYLTQSGRIAADMADSYREQNPFYAPFYRVMDDAPPAKMGAGKYSEIGNPAKRLKGSSRDLHSPIENMIKNVFAFVNAAERQRVGNAILLSTEIKGMGDMVEVIPFPLEPRKILKDDFINLLKKYATVETIQSVQTTQSAIEKSLSGLATAQTPPGRMLQIAKEALTSRGWSSAEADQIIDRIKNAPAGPERQPIIEKTIEKTVIMTIKEKLGFGGMPDAMIHAFRPAYRAGPSEAIFYDHGKPVLVEMSPELAAAVKGVEADNMGILQKVLSLPAKMLRTGATMTPEFIARNPIRDQMTAWFYTNYGFRPVWDLAKGIYHMLGVTETYQRFNASGGALAHLGAIDRDFLNQKLKELMRMQTPGEAVKHPVRALKNFMVASASDPLKTLQIISMLMEEGTRIGAFARAQQKLGPSLEALIRSGVEGRDVSQDFSRLGAKAKAINSYVAFFGANIGGVDRMARAFKTHPGRTALKMFIGATIPSLLLWYAQHDDPYYDEIPTWAKLITFPIIFHNDDGSLKRIVLIPKPFTPGIIFGSLPTIFLDWLKDNDPKHLGTALKAISDALLPPLWPAAVLPWVENYANRSTFFDRPIVPQNLEDLPPYLQYTEHTSETAKLIARAGKDLPGVKEYASPLKVEHVVRGWTGGMGQYALEGMDRILTATGAAKIKPRPTMTLSDLPLVKGFLMRYPSANVQSIQDFYQEYTRLRQEWAGKSQEGGWRGMGVEMKPLEKMALGMPPELAYMEGAAKILTALRKNVMATEKSETMTEERKRQVIDRTYFEMMNVARRALGKKPIEDKRITGAK